MESLRLEYKQDGFGNAMYAKICFSKESSTGSRPIVLVYHAGGLVVGSSEMINKAQLKHICKQGAVVVAPNYRLCPQVTAREALIDCEEALSWASTHLPKILRDDHEISVDSSKIAAMGHSVGGTIALHLAALNRGVQAVTAFYPGLYYSDPTNLIFQTFTRPPFGTMPDFTPSDNDWIAIKPAGVQLSETPLTTPGTIPPPRGKWQAGLLKHGKLMEALCPDGDYTVVDPLTSAKLMDYKTPTAFVQGVDDDIPGSGPELVRRAVKDLKAAGVGDVRTQFVEGASHMFDLPPMVGTSDLGQKWEAAKAGVDFLFEYLKS